MAEPGWYPDPGGSGGYRYWDGRRWSSESAPGSTRKKPRRPIGAVAAIVILLIAAVITLAVWRPWSGPFDITDNPPTTRVSAGDDGEPSPTPSTPVAPSPTPQRPTEQQPCPAGQPSARSSSPMPSRITGGGLSFAALEGWDTNRYLGTYTWAYDVADQSFHVQDAWYNDSAVGAIRIDAGFADPETAAQLITQCIASSDFYTACPAVTPRRVHSRAVTVDGRPGYSVRTDVGCQSRDYPEIHGDVLEVIIVDTGSAELLGMYVGTATLEHQPTLDALDSAIASLRVG